MDIFLFSMNATLPVVLCMAVGIFVRWKKIVDQSSSNRLSSLCFNLFLPTLTFSNVRSIDFRGDFSPRLLTYSFLGILVLTAALLIILRPIVRDKSWLAACVHVGFRSNFLMLGMPLAENMFGTPGVRIAAMLIPVTIIPFNLITLFLFSLADSEESTSPIALIKSTATKIVRNPLIISSVLGILASLSSVQFPTFLETTLRNIGGVASTLCLVVLGSQISLEMKIKYPRRAFGMTFTRLVLVPAVMVPIFVVLGFRGPELGALFILFSAPCANSCAIMAQQYHVKPEFTAQVVALTTLFSGFTAFAGIYLLRALGLF